MWNWIQWGLWRAARRDSTSTSVAKGRVGKMWACCWMDKGRGKGWGMYSMPLPWFLLVGAAFRNPRPLRLEAESGATKTYPQWRRIRLWNVYSNWTCTSPQELMGCIHEWWGSWLMSLQSHSLKGHTDQQRFLKAGRKQMSLFASEARKRIWGTTGWSGLP